jgi:hypothetical protein
MLVLGIMKHVASIKGKGEKVMATVRIKLSKDGGIKVDAEGFVGASCEQATGFLDKLFGDAERKDYKPEYWMDAVIGDELPEGHCG